MQALQAPDIELKALVDSSGMSIASIAESLGVARPSISLLINGKYKNHELREKIVKLCKEKIANSMFQTEGQRRLMAVLDATLKDREFSLVVGPSGVGKTFTIHQFIATNNSKANIIYFKVSKLMSAGECLRQLCEALGVCASGSNGAKLKRIKDKAKEVDMIVIDEADLLIEQDRPKYFARKIEIFRELAEVTAVVLVGLPELENAIYENVHSYVYSRLGYYARVGEPSPEELFEFARQHTITNKEIVGASIGRGYFRFLIKVARKAREIGENYAYALMFLGRRK